MADITYGSQGKTDLPLKVSNIPWDKYITYNLKDAARHHTRSYWKSSNNTSSWHLPMFPEVILEIFKIFDINDGHNYSLRFLDKAEQILKQHEQSQIIAKKLSILTTDNIDAAIKGKIVEYPTFIKQINGSRTLYHKIIQKPDFLHQKIGYIWGINVPGLALYWEMGCGKTKTTIQIANYKIKSRIIDTILVFAPLSILKNWEREFEKWSDLRGLILKGSSKDKQKQLDYSNIIIVNYETLLRVDYSDFVTDKTMIIADESSLIKNPAAKRTRNLIKLARQTKHKIILSGTPITQGAFDVFSQFKIIDASVFGYSYSKFKKRYFYTDEFRLVPRQGETTLNGIRKKIETKATRFIKAQCLDLPPKIYEKRMVDFSDLQKEKYGQMLDGFLTWLDNNTKATAPIILTQMLRLSQITSGFIKTTDGVEVAIDKVNPKLNELDNLLDEITGQIVIWARFQYDVKLIGSLLYKKGISHKLFYGEIGKEQRWKIEQDFQDKRFNVFVGTPDTGGVGLNLVPVDYVIYFSKDYSLHHRLQSEDRSHRIGMADKITYVDILIKKSIDVGIHSILKGKKDVADIVTGDRDRIKELVGMI